MNNEDKPLNVPELRDGVDRGSVTIAAAREPEKPYLYEVEYVRLSGGGGRVLDPVGLGKATSNCGVDDLTVVVYLRTKARTQASVVAELSKMTEFEEDDVLTRFQYRGRISN